ncbi:LysR family transcriptional regulator [Providencia vermicola]|uniref:LysR family transcriptional regulator n=1 Tax=Providencia vermicola TaxID=333965 RepID=UPI002201F5C1|nr:LysR family transcriptional regulator [Providencia stuartii]
MVNKTSLSIDNLLDLRVFVDVVETSSFTRSAERLALSRSAIGKCIARLESRLQTRLFNRTTRSIHLSDEGQVVYGSALKILQEIESVENILSQGQQKPRGLLRITVPVVFGKRFIMPLVHDYLVRWPEVEVDIDFSDDYCDIVKDGFDIAIRIGGNDDNRLVRKVLAPHRFITCASPQYLQEFGYPTTVQSLEQYNTLIFRHRGLTVPWQFKSGSTVQNYMPKGRLVLNDTEAILNAALQGYGICQLGAFLVGEQIAQGNLCPILTEFSKPEAPICALYPTKLYLPPKVRQFLQLFDEYWQGRAIWEEKEKR